MMRLDRFLAAAGYGTRQEVKKLIRSGKVSVNGERVNNPEVKLDEEHTEVRVDGSLVLYEKYRYIMFHKPSGCVSSAHEKGERSILEYIDETYASDLFPVGRLDKDTEGLMLLTNDGDLAHRLLSPSKHVDKKYYAELKKPVIENDIIQFREGIDIGDKDLTIPAVLETADCASHVYITLHEGRYHQIKRMFQALHNEVLYLKRISMKNLLLDESLKPGEYRKLTEDEIKDLKEHTKS